MEWLTPKQSDVYNVFVRRCDDGMPPTMQEIATELHISKVTIFGHIQELKRKGYLSQSDRKGWRNLTPIDSPAIKLAAIVLRKYPGDSEVSELARKLIPQKLQGV